MDSACGIMHHRILMISCTIRFSMTDSFGMIPHLPPFYCTAEFQCWWPMIWSEEAQRYAVWDSYIRKKWKFSIFFSFIQPTSELNWSCDGLMMLMYGDEIAGQDPTILILLLYNPSLQSLTRRCAWITCVHLNLNQYLCTGIMISLPLLTSKLFSS